MVDPANAYRIAMIRSRVVDITTIRADENIDMLAKKYLGQQKYPFRRPDEQRVSSRSGSIGSTRRGSTSEAYRRHPAALTDRVR